MNDVSLHRQPGNRVADLAYSVGSDEIGRVRCDGLVVATPAGSTGYNLANGGPVMAWGVEGFVGLVHRAALADRALAGRRPRRSCCRCATAPRTSRSTSAIDGRPVVRARAPGGDLEVRFAANKGLLAQLPGTTFYSACGRSSGVWRPFLEPGASRARPESCRSRRGVAGQEPHRERSYGISRSAKHYLVL